MIKLNTIPLDYEPRKKILTKLHEKLAIDYVSPEMSDSESAFLCEFLEANKSKKVLEVGVAKGGTTSIILQTLEDSGEPYEMHSVDLNEQCYNLKTKRTGYMATFAKENNLFTPPPSQPCGVNTSFIWANTCRRSLTRLAATLTS